MTAASRLISTLRVPAGAGPMPQSASVASPNTPPVTLSGGPLREQDLTAADFGEAA